MKPILVDERTEHINGMAALICLVLTQLALMGVVVYKRYILGLPQEAYTEITWIAFFSMGGYWLIRLYLSGVLPVLSIKQILVIYVLLVAVISVPTYFIHGWPAAENWYEVLYPVIGVALVLGFYSLAAYLGKRRIEQMNMQ